VQVPTPPAVSSFESLGLDARLLQAISIEQYAVPTPVQAKAIPLALQGRDILGTDLASSVDTVQANSSSSRKDRFWKDRGLCPSRTAINSQAESGFDHQTEHICAYSRPHKRACQPSHQGYHHSFFNLRQRYTDCQPHVTNPRRSPTGAPCFYP